MQGICEHKDSSCFLYRTTFQLLQESKRCSMNSLFAYVPSDDPQRSGHVTKFSYDYTDNNWPHHGLMVMTLLWDYNCDWSLLPQWNIKLKTSWRDEICHEHQPLAGCWGHSCWKKKLAWNRLDGTFYLGFTHKCKFLQNSYGHIEHPNSKAWALLCYSSLFWKASHKIWEPGWRDLLLLSPAKHPPLSFLFLPTPQQQPPGLKNQAHAEVPKNCSS